MTWLAWSLGGFSLLITFGFLLLSIWHMQSIRRAGADRAGRVSLVSALRGDQPRLVALFAALAAQEFCGRRRTLAGEIPDLWCSGHSDELFVPGTACGMAVRSR